MTKKQLSYYALTGFLVLAMIGSGVMDLVQPEPLVESFANLGYPMYLATILGVAKLLGVFALLNPRFERIKEWAYAGFAFDFIGAALSHGAVGEFAEIVPPIVLLSILAGSYALRQTVSKSATSPALVPAAA